MCIINRSTKLIAIQHEKKHGKGSKNSSAYFDSRIEIEQKTDNLIADYSFDECIFFKDDDDMCAYVFRCLMYTTSIAFYAIF